MTELPALDEEMQRFLEQEAQRQGKDPAVLAGELIEAQLAKLTAPRSRGVITPFRRRT